MTEKRTARIAFTKSGGTAKGLAITNRVTLPRPWIEHMEISKEDRTVIIEYDFEKKTITIKKDTTLPSTPQPNT